MNGNMSGSMFHVRYVSVFDASKVPHLSLFKIEFNITFEDIIPLTSLFSTVMYYPSEHK